MAHPVLYSFDIEVTKERADRSLLPFAGARVDLYEQGATVKVAATIASGASGVVTVYDTGSLVPNSGTVQVGVRGPSLGVGAITPATGYFWTFPTVALQNNTGASVTLNVGDRLLHVSRRVKVYSDPLGKSEIANPLTSDSSGRALAYVASRRFDYVTPGETVTLASTSSSLNGSSSLQWTHADNTAGVNRTVLVGISWEGATGDESISSATYDGVNMELVSSTGAIALYKLTNPPSGSKSIQISFTSSSPPASVKAIGGAVTFGNVLALGQPSTAATTSTTPSVSVSDLAASDTLFDLLARVIFIVD